MNRSWPTAAIAAAGVVIAVVIGMASPASAGDGPSISVDSPASGAVLTGDPTISGDATMPGSLDRMGTVRVSLSSSVAPDLPAPCDPCSSGHGQSTGFSWSPSLPYNGPYQARVTATGNQFLFGALTGEGSAEATVSFRMEVPPADPGGVHAEVSADKTIRISWSRNDEPDMIGYRVQRKDPGASTYRDVGAAVPQPTVSTVDSAPTQPGTFTYQVQAIRAGRSGDASTAVGSGFSSTQLVVPAAAVVAPPSTPGAAPAAPPPEGAPPTPNLSAFLKGSGGGGLPKAVIPSAPLLPDGSFQENLPFSLPSATEGGRDSNEAIGLNASSSGDGARAVMIPVASGLLLCLVALHVRRLNGALAPAGGNSQRHDPLPVDIVAEPTVVEELDRDRVRSSGVRILGDEPNQAWGAFLGGSSGSRDPDAVLGGSEGPSGLLSGEHSPSGALGGSEASSGPLTRRTSPRPAPVSFETWLKGGSAGDAAGGDGALADDDDDDAKWAPLTTDHGEATELSGHDNGEESGQTDDEPPSPRAWGDILVTPGAGTTRRSW